MKHKSEIHEIEFIESAKYDHSLKTGVVVTQ